MPDTEQHNIPAEVRQQLRPLMDQLRADRLIFEKSDQLVGGAIRVAMAGLGLDVNKAYKIDSDCTKFTLEVPANE